MKKTFTLKGTTYPFDTVFSIGTTEEEIATYLKKTHGFELDADLKINPQMDGRTVLMAGGQTILWLKKFRKNNAYDLSLLTHETLHATQFLFEHIGIGNCEESWEAWAYYQQNLILNFLNEIQRS